MTTTEGGTHITNRLRARSTAEVRAEIRAGLLATPRSLPSKYFYDARGSRLFEEITRLEEYYPTRTEMSILRRVMPRLAGDIADTDIVELGSGDCSKISLVLAAVPAAARPSVRYVPVDVSEAAIVDSAGALRERFPGLRIHGLVADFHADLDELPPARRRFFCFFGGTIGNLAPDEQVRLLSRLAGVMKPGDRLLLGLDMLKDVDVIERAYNDARGVTAAFNRNILDVVNGLMDTDFNGGDFDHAATFDADANRIQMRLVARRPVVARSPHLPRPVAMEAGDWIHTEDSHKFGPERIAALAARSGLEVAGVHTDPRAWFSLVELVGGS